MMTEQEVFEKVKSVVVEQLGVNESEVTKDTQVFAGLITE